MIPYLRGVSKAYSYFVMAMFQYLLEGTIFIVITY